MEIEFKFLTSNDLNNLIELINVFVEVFQMKDSAIPGKEHLKELLGNSDFTVLVVGENNQVVGGLTVRTLDR
jgi:hypothetical protein